MILSLSAKVSPCFILILFLSKHFMAYLTIKQQNRLPTGSYSMILFVKSGHSFPYIFPVSAFLQPYTSPKPPLPMIRCTLKSFMVSWGRTEEKHLICQKTCLEGVFKYIQIHNYNLILSFFYFWLIIGTWPYLIVANNAKITHLPSMRYSKRCFIFILLLQAHYYSWHMSSSYKFGLIIKLFVTPETVNKTHMLL